MNRSPFGASLLIPFVLVCFALSPHARADCQEGCDTSNGNTLLGDDALLNNSTGGLNIAIGFNALFSNTSGGSNTAIGSNALVSNTTGYENTATGFEALFSNVGLSYFNTATGAHALYSNTTSLFNTATGVDALRGNTIGNNNTANGSHALEKNTIGNNNIALGYGAGRHLTRGDNNIYVGDLGAAAESSTIHIGKVGTHHATFIAGISGATVPTGVPVIIDTDCHLGTTTSSARFKEAVKPMDKASEAILALKPVSFRYKHDLDPAGIPQFGLVAEDVEKVNPNLVARDEQGKAYTVRYEAVNAMLLNEFLKARRQIDVQQKQIETLTAGLQKVSAQLEVDKFAPRTFVANQ